MEHKHSVYDIDTHFVIDPVTRSISRGTNTKTTLIQGDHNSEVYTFDIPRIIDGHDTMLCNSVEVHYDNIDSSTKEKSRGFYKVEDMRVSDANPEMLCFTWLVKEPATKYVGKIEFSIKFKCVEDGKAAYKWNTGKNSDLTVDASNDNSEVATEEPYPDIIAQWEESLFGIGDTEEQRIKDVSATEQAAIAAKGEAVRSSIPEDYTGLQAQADRTERSQAPAIVLKAEGESVVVNDSSDCYLKGLRIFGKSTQDGTPTPDAPAEIVSVEKPSVGIYGSNLANAASIEKGANTSVVVSADGYTITCTGGADKPYTSSPIYLPMDMLRGKTVILKADSITNSQDSGNKGGNVQLNIRDSDKMRYVAISPNNLMATTTISEDVTRVDLNIYTNNSASAFESENTTVIAGLRLSVVDGEWEQHKDEQRLVVTRSLHGIPVSSGGNYTDANGQQWICDEVDLARGVYVQRVRKQIVTGNPVFNETADQPGRFSWNCLPGDFVTGREVCLCNFARWRAWGISDYAGVYDYGGVSVTQLYYSPAVSMTADEVNAKFATMIANGTHPTVVAQLATPVETTLSDAEIAAFKALYTNKPNTTILNDSGAYMAVEYVADTKTYIDNKIAELMQN